MGGRKEVRCCCERERKKACSCVFVRAPGGGGGGGGRGDGGGDKETELRKEVAASCAMSGTYHIRVDARAVPLRIANRDFFYVTRAEVGDSRGVPRAIPYGGVYWRTIHRGPGAFARAASVEE